MRRLLGIRSRSRATLLVLAGLGLAARASAIEPEITGEATGQFYDVRSPTGETILERRRVTATLGVSGYDILKPDPKDRNSPEITFRARVRYDADYGANGQEVTPGSADFVPGFSRGPVDLMYAYIEGRRFLHGTTGFKLGRQYQTDVLGWWSFDGADLKVTTPFYVQVEGYGGLEQRGGLPLSTSRFESDGIWRGNRSGFTTTADSTLYPQFQPTNLAPAFGVALESAGPTWIHGRVVYRRVYNTGSVGTSDFSSGLYVPTVLDTTRISSDRLGYAVDVDMGKFAGLKGGLVYDFYDNQVTSIFASLDTYEGPLSLSLDYDYYAPVFDGDSIWNFFAGDPMNDVGLRGSVTATDRLSVSAGGHVRIYNVETAPDNPADSSANVSPQVVPGLYPSNGHPFDGGGSLGARYKWGEGNVNLRAAADLGEEGERVGGDVSGEELLEARYVFRGRVGVWQWDDKLQPTRDATNFTYVLGVGYRFAPRCQAVFEWEHDINRLVGQRFRTMINVSVAVMP
jgi:hypothetical protein